MSLAERKIISSNFGLIIPLVFSILIGACTYETTKPDLKINFLLNQGQFESLQGLIIEFANEHRLTIKDSSRSFPSGISPILIELSDSNENIVIKINDMMDKRRLEISFFDCENCELDRLHDALKENLDLSSLGTIKQEGF